MATTSQLSAGAQALAQRFPDASSDYLVSLAAIVLDAVRVQCASRSPFHSLQCTKTTIGHRIHSSGTYAWADGGSR